MNNIDKEIDEFKSNLSLIEKVSKEVSNNNDNFTKVIKECRNLEEIKKQLTDEIDNIKKENKEYISTISDLCEKINEKNDETLKKIASQNQELKSLKEQVGFLTTNNDKYSKIIIFLVAITLILCAILFLIK